MSMYQPPQQPYGYGQPTYPPPAGPAPVGPPPGALGNQGARLAARFLDGVFMLLALLLVAGLVVLIQNLTVDNDSIGMVAGVIGYSGIGVVLLCYEPVMHWKSGATYGKRICGLRVARLDDGRHLSFGRAWLRWFTGFLMGFVPFLGLLDVLWCLWDKPFQQCLHDKAANSVVLTTRP
ncbi:RDD family protein [Streptomyces sp. NPDC002405]|uniref:RDD family protein n=1 Tax=unclassified Streptomyces TaxID=2593676 RepID=UPI0036A3A402